MLFIGLQSTRDCYQIATVDAVFPDEYVRSVNFTPQQPLCLLLITASDSDLAAVRGAIEDTWDSPILARVSDEQAFCNAFRQQAWDAVLSDAALDQFGPESVLTQLQQQRVDVPFIVLTTEGDHGQALRLLHAGADDCLDWQQLSRLPFVLERELAAVQLRSQAAEQARILGTLASRLPGYLFQRLQSCDGSFRFTYLSESLREQFGVDPDALMADPGNFWALIHPEDRDDLAAVFAEAHTKLKPYQTEYRAILPGNRMCWVRVQAQPTRLDNGDVVWDGIGLDVTAEKSARERLYYLAHFDSVTDLPNRHMFLDRLGQTIKQTDRTGRGLALHMIDLDNFKEVNDTLGHAAGDILLRQVAARLSGMIRESDTLARLGGDEFILIQTGIMEPDAPVNLASKLLAALQQAFTIENRSLYAQASIGVACYGPMFTAMDIFDNQVELLKRADLALYAAKNQGRNTYRFYEQNLISVE